MNRYEKACKEWLKGCSCSDIGKPEQCYECTKVFREYVQTLNKPILTEFQQLIINCKPEINKPVFVLSGCGSGKTYALNERAKKEQFAYYHYSPRIFKLCNKTENLNVTIDPNGSEYDTVVYENYYPHEPETLIEISKLKKVIIFTNGVDFIENFANKLKGEYTIISGFNVDDNIYLVERDPNYKKMLETLVGKDKQRYLYGGLY